MGKAGAAKRAETEFWIECPLCAGAGKVRIPANSKEEARALLERVASHLPMEQIPDGPAAPTEDE